MTFFRVAAMCLAAAMITSAIRGQRPEIATAISLAVGIGAPLLLIAEARKAGGDIDAVLRAFGGDDALLKSVLRGAGIAIVSELGDQVCIDAGERALGSRIALAGRIAILLECVPMVVELCDVLNRAAG